PCTTARIKKCWLTTLWMMGTYSLKLQPLHPPASQILSKPLRPEANPRYLVGHSIAERKKFFSGWKIKLSPSHLRASPYYGVNVAFTRLASAPPSFSATAHSGTSWRLAKCVGS